MFFRSDGGGGSHTANPPYHGYSGSQPEVPPKQAMITTENLFKETAETWGAKRRSSVMLRPGVDERREGGEGRGSRSACRLKRAAPRVGGVVDSI